MQQFFLLAMMLLQLLPAHAQQLPDSLQHTNDSAKVLAAVKIRAPKPIVERLADRTILNVQADPLAQASNVFELLQRAPGVVTKGEEDIGLAGRGTVTIYLNGKPLQMAQRDLALYLKSLPGNMVDRVELISNPPSSFDAAGTGGIINIQLKKNPSLGVNGSLAAAYDQNKHHRFGSTFNLNHRTARLYNYLNYTFSEGLQHTAGRFDRTLPQANRTFQNQTVDKDSWTGHNFRLGSDWQMNRQSILSFAIRGDIHHTLLETPGVTTLGKGNNSYIDSTVVANNSSEFPTRQLNYNLHYNFEDSTGQVLSMDADFTSYHNRVSTDIGNVFFNNRAIEQGRLENRLGILTMIKIIAVKADYNRRLGAAGKLEAGVKSAWVITDNELAAMVNRGNGWLTDSNRTNNFNYRERIYAFYSSMGKSWKKWEYKAGLRFEYTQVNGISTDIANNKQYRPDTAYLNIFPSMFLSYGTANDGHLALSYVKRITRPNYQDMNPFETVLDNYSADMGNPYLQPAYQRTVEAGYTSRRGFGCTIGYSMTTAIVQEITRQEGDRSLSVPENIASQTAIYLSLSMPIRLFPWWSWYCNGTIARNRQRGKLQDYPVDFTSWSGNAYVNSSLQLGKAWAMQLSSWLRFPGMEGISRTKTFGSIDGALQKSWKDKTWVIRLVVNDIFNMQRVTDISRFATVDYTYYRKWESRGVRLAMTWKFGNRQLKNGTEREIGEGSERIKQ